jgi:hypothetical protein
MIKKLFLFLPLLILFSFTCYATGENWPIGGRGAGMSNASVTLTDFWSINHNQAGMIGVKTISSGIYYENRFGLKNLSIKAGAVVLPTRSGVFGLSMTYFGYALYNESKIGLAYAKSFGTKFSAGVQLDYLGTHIAENYGNASAVAAEIGLLYQVNKNISIGTHVYNPTRAKVASYNNERAPTILKLGLSYQFSEKVILAIESEKDIQHNPVFKAGVEYRPIKALYFRTGISTNPVLNSFGFGIEYHNFNLDFAASYHQALGFTPQCSLVFHVNKISAQPNLE